MNHHHNNMNKRRKFLTKITKTFIGKKDSIDLYDEGGSNPPQYRIPSMMEVCEAIDECPYETSPVVMEDCVNDEHEDSTRKD